MKKTVLKAASIDEALQMIRDVCSRAENPPRKPALMEGANLINEVTQRSFRESVDPVGNPWQPVKRRMPPPILIRTGLLMTSALFATKSPTITEDSMLISVPSPKYGLFHLTGTSRMPARPWLGLNNDVVDEITERAADDAVNYAVSGATEQQ